MYVSSKYNQIDVGKTTLAKLFKIDCICSETHLLSCPHLHVPKQSTSIESSISKRMRRFPQYKNDRVATKENEKVASREKKEIYTKLRCGQFHTTSAGLSAFLPYIA